MIKTKRLILTKPSIDNLAELHALCSKAEVNIFNPSGPTTDISETKAMLKSWLEDWRVEGVGYYFARTLTDAAFVGYMGVAYRQFLDEKLLNLAYRIEPKFWKKGYTVEAVHAILEKVSIEYGEPIIRVLTKKDNIPSIAVARKLGFIYNEKFDHYPDKGDVYLFNVEKDISDKIGKQE